MTKKIIAVAFGLLLAAGVVFSASDEQHGRSVDNVLEEIRGELNLKADEKIDAEKVSDSLLEELGEAVMSLAHPDPRQHELMDDMMGGEGSDRLAAAHRVMGYSYLKNGSYGGPMGMMGSGGGGMMMGGGMMGGMMGSYNEQEWQRETQTHMTWGTVVPWTIAGLLAAAVTTLSIVLATR